MSKKDRVITLELNSAFSCGVYQGLPEKITEFDLSFVNIELIKLGSGKFYNRMLSIAGKEWTIKTDSAFNRLNREMSLITLYVAFPIDKEKGLDSGVLRNLETFLQIMFPAHFKLIMEVGFEESNEKDLYRQCYLWDRSGAVNQRFVFWNKGLDFNIDHKNEIVEVLKILFERYDHLKKEYEILFECYQNSFYQWSLDMAIINLTMGLESLIKTESEINHQIARTVAIINSNNKDEGRIIYSNIKKLYGLRSKIVHGDKPKKDFKHYYLSLKAIVSRTIIEIVLLNLKKEKLRELIIESGYGERSTFAKDYKSPVLNMEVIQNLKTKLENL